MVIREAPYVVDLSRQEPVAKGSAAAAARGAAVQGQKGTDRVELSSQMLELDRLKRDLDALPGLRLDRVALAKQNLQAGGYQLDGRVVAQKMMAGIARV